MASSSNSIVSALEELHRQLADELSTADGTNVVAAKEEEEATSSSFILRSNIDKLKREWGFQKMFLEFIRHWTDWTDADEAVQQQQQQRGFRSLIAKMKSAEGEITMILNMACEKKYPLDRPSELAHLLSLSLLRIELFKPEILAALDSCNSLKPRSPLPHDYYSWISFVALVKKNLEIISNMFDDRDSQQIDVFRSKLTSLLDFLGQARVGSSIGYVRNEDGRIRDFFNHVASVAISTAYQSSVYWFNYPNLPFSTSSTSSIAGEKLLNLLQQQQQQIDLPTSPDFLQLTIQLLKSTSNFSFLQFKDNAILFLDYLLGEHRQDSHHWGLRYLVSKLINNNDQEGDQSLFSDIAAVLREALPLRNVLFVTGLSFGIPQMYSMYFRGRYTTSSISPSSSEGPFNPKLWFFEQKIWLLIIETFLNEKMKASSSTIVFTHSDYFQTSDIVMGLELLRASCKYIPEPAEEGLEKTKQILKELEDVARKIDSFRQSFDDSQAKARDTLFMLYLRTVLLKAKLFLVDLLSNNASLMAFKKDQLETLHDGLKLLTLFVTYHPVENKVDAELVFTRVEVVAKGIISLYHTFFGCKLTEEIMKEMLISLSDFMDKLNLLKAELKEMCPRFLRSSFPKMDRLGFIGFLVGNLEELLKRDLDSMAPVKHYVKEIQLNLESLRFLLMKLDSENPKIKDIAKHVTEIAYELEYAIDSIEVEIGSSCQHFLHLYYLLEEVRLVKMQASGIYEEKTNDDINAPDISKHLISRAGRPKIEKVLVPLGDQEEAIVDRLTRGSSQLEIVPVIGMPGIGKTTLARKVYDDPKVAYHFHIRAWCFVSHEYEKRELLLEILSNISVLTDNIYQMTDEDLDLKLFRHLKQTKYLIVMDDVWNVRAWKDLENSFPDDGNGSRILITSRLHDVARKSKSGTVPHSLRLLSSDESWKLLQMKLFHGRGCPEELLDAGKRIAQNCEGLPLAVVAIAGLLRRTEEKQDNWEKVAKNLSSLIVDDPETRCKDILQLSYKNLPAYLKPCFLYFGAFPEYKDILFRKLIWLWIAEGFIQKTESKSLEDVAEEYLMDLIDSSLVLVSKRRANGRGKACRIHDMLRDLCLSKAREENFFQLLTRHDQPYASFDDLDYGAAFDDYFPSNPKTYEVHRLCICLKRKHFVLSRPSGPHTRSLIFFAASDTYPRCPYDVSFISHHFKLLRVLDLEDINVGVYFPVGIELLVQLKFLSVSGDMDTIPPSISNLWRLETFIVKGLKGKVMLPATIWFMTRLRHLHVNKYAVFGLQDDKLEHFAQLNNLITLSLPSFSYGEDTERILQMLPNIQKLGCIFSESWDSSRDCNRFPLLNFLSQLESLKIFYSGRARNPGELNFPANLKRLTLLNFRLPWHRISDIGRLENLEVLKLLSRAFEGQTWNMIEGEFVNLKFLKLDSLNISQWNATSDHLPNLQHLVLHSCKDLEEVPYAFAEIPTLEMIEVHSCRQSTEESVRRIEEEEIEGLKILINH